MRERTEGRGESRVIVERLTTPHDLIVMLKTVGEAGRSEGGRERCQTPHTTVLCEGGWDSQLTASRVEMGNCVKIAHFVAFLLVCCLYVNNSYWHTDITLKLDIRLLWLTVSGETSSTKLFIGHVLQMPSPLTFSLLLVPSCSLQETHCFRWPRFTDRFRCSWKTW